MGWVLLTQKERSSNEKTSYRFCRIRAVRSPGHGPRPSQTRPGPDSRQGPRSVGDQRERVYRCRVYALGPEPTYVHDSSLRYAKQLVRVESVRPDRRQTAE